MSGFRVGVVGATGLVGTMMRSILIERDFPVDNLRFFASERSAGQTLLWKNEEVQIEDAAQASFEGMDIVLLSAGGTVSKEIAPRIAEAGAVVIDNSSAWRMDPDVPLVVSEVNPDAAELRPKGIIANPNCTTMVVMPVVKPLHDNAQLKRIVASTYQAVSGAGVKGVRELEVQLEKLNGRGDELARGAVTELPQFTAFPATIANNVLSIAGNLVGEETDEEHKFRNESRKILDIPSLDVGCTCVRVPVYTGHSVAVTAEFQQAISVDEAQKLLADAPGVKIVEMPTPLDAAGGDLCLVGRLRQPVDHPNRLAFFVSGDNLRKGAALNAVQIAELVASSLAS